MFSGGDSSGGGGINERNSFGNFHRAAAQAAGLTTPTTAGGSIDWASLAQQWIQMRDYAGADIGSTISVPVPDAPPPPNISGNYSKLHEIAQLKKTKLEEQGEADMEMDDEEEKAPAAPSMHIMPTMPMQPNWFLPHSATVQPIIGTVADIATIVQQEQVTMPPTEWNVWPPRVLLPPSLNASASTANPTAHIPSLMKIAISDPSIKSAMPEDGSNANNLVNNTMDAARRKMLPAWIREGLEKMEREKQKQLEKDTKESKNISEDDSNSHDGTDTPPISRVYMVNNKKPTVLENDSSGNDDEEENDNKKAVAITAAARKVSKSNNEADKDYSEHYVVQEMKTGKTYEQKLSDLMTVVRRTLTELLLEVTNEEICNISQEAIKSLKNKATAAQLIPKSAISTITGKLGLAAYDDSSNETSASESDDNSLRNENNYDSEEDIKTNIRTKRRTFAKTCEEIEERIAESALREEQKLKYYTQQERQRDEEEQKLQRQREVEHENLNNVDCSSGSNSIIYKAMGRGLGSSAAYSSGKGYDKEFGETSDSKLQRSNGKRHNRDRTTRFSDNKDSKATSLLPAADYISHLTCSNQIEKAAQKINSVLSQIPVFGPGSTLPVLPIKFVDAPIKSVLNANEEVLGPGSAKEKSSSKKQSGSRKSLHQNSDDNDGSSSDSSDSSQTSSSSSRNSSKHSRSSHSKHKSSSSASRRHHKSSSSSNRKSNHKRSTDRGRDRHYDDRKSRRRCHSSDSEDDGKDEFYSSRRYRSSRSSRNHDHHREQKSRTSTRSRSRSHSRSQSTYSSRRRRH